jgi:hypothetical protein
MEKSICNIPSCRNYQRYCRIHLSGSLKQPKPIAKESKERKEINRKEYAPKAAEFVKNNPKCQANIKDVCSGASQCVHHKKGKNSKEDLLDNNYWLAVCFNCHRVIEDNPAFARQEGFSISRHKKERA